MEDKTLLEELLERSPDERMHKRKMDKAYQLMTMGFRDEADALFDEILAEEPFNRDAMTGKKLIERQKAVENRLDNLAARARTSIPEPKPGAAPEEPSEELLTKPRCFAPHWMSAICSRLRRNRTVFYEPSISSNRNYRIGSCVNAQLKKPRHPTGL